MMNQSTHPWAEPLPEGCMPQIEDVFKITNECPTEVHLSCSGRTGQAHFQTIRVSAEYHDQNAVVRFVNTEPGRACCPTKKCDGYFRNMAYYTMSVPPLSKLNVYTLCGRQVYLDVKFNDAHGNQGSETFCV